MQKEEVPLYHRLAVAQISFNPAYVDTAGMSDLHEPVPGDQFHGLYRVADIPEVATVRSNIAQRYLHHISEKVRSLAEFASTQGVELLVFPEYSIPADALDLCSDLASRLHLTIVAGSHTVTQTAIERYRRLRIETGTGGKILGRAACPVFMGDGKSVLFEKTTRSKWESDMVPGIQISPITVRLRSGTIRLQVLICIDALQDPSPGGRRQFRDSIPTLLAVPALSPDSSLFRHKGALVLASGRCVVLANSGEYGGTRIFARAERCRRWFATNDGTEPLPKASEALVVADIDLAHQYEVRQYTGESFPVRDIQIYPLLYPGHSDLCKQYWAFQKLVHSDSPPQMQELRASAGAFASADPREFPFLLRDKLKHFLENVDGAGLADMAAWKTWIHAAVVSSAETTAALRVQSCASAMDVVSQRAILDRYPSRVSQLTDTYAFLAKSYASLTADLPMSGGANKSVESTAPSDRATVFEPPFFDRETQLDAIRKSIEARDRPCHIIAGMRGIGKGSLAKEVFKKVILPTWKRVWIQVTEGMSLPRLLAEIAYRLDLKVPDDLPSEEVSQADVTQNVLLYISQTPRLALGLADIQHLLGPDRNFTDPTAQVFLERMVRAACDKNNKLVLTTTQTPQWGGDVLQLIETTYLGGMDDKSAEQLFSFWLRFESEDLNAQTLAYPEKALGLIRGHPLALKLAAKMWAERPQSEAAADMALFKKIRETMVAYVLDQVHLAPHEEEFLRFASVFRVPVKREAFVRWKGDQGVALLESLLGQSLLEVESETYLLHPLVRDHYYMIAEIEALRPLHATAGQYFLDQFKEARLARLSVDPEIVSEAVHHLLCAGEREKVRELGQYRHELRPVARMHYYKRSYDLALKEYRLLIDLDPDDYDAHFHLALIYANDDRWGDAEAHFGRASRLKPAAHWILQGYAHVLLRKRRELPRVELMLRQAENLNQFDSYTLLDLGVLCSRTGRDPEAETYFQRAIEADSENTRALYAFARFLRDGGRLEEALPMAVAALESKPTDARNRALVRELRQRVRQVQSATTGDPDNQGETVEGS